MPTAIENELRYYCAKNNINIDDYFFKQASDFFNTLMKDNFEGYVKAIVNSLILKEGAEDRIKEIIVSEIDRYIFYLVKEKVDEKMEQKLDSLSVEIKF